MAAFVLKLLVLMLFGHTSTRCGRVASAELMPEEGYVPPVSDKCWIFMHLQKCGGTTVKNILSQTWGKRYFIYDSMRWKLGNKFLQEFGQKLVSAEHWNVMTGGYPEALRRSTVVNKKCKWFTMFRHPISRIVSAYFYCKHLPGDIACASMVVDARDVDLIAFAKHWGNFAMRQFVLSMVDNDAVMEYGMSSDVKDMLPQVENMERVSGWYFLKLYLDRQASEFGSELSHVPDVAMFEMLRPVQDLLRDRYAAVGILENFNATLGLFDKALDMPSVEWQKQFIEDGKGNVDRAFEEEKEKVLKSAWTNTELKEYLWLDLLLYEHAVEVFLEQARHYDVL